MQADLLTWKEEEDLAAADASSEARRMRRLPSKEGAQARLEELLRKDLEAPLRQARKMEQKLERRFGNAQHLYDLRPAGAGPSNNDA